MSPVDPTICGIPTSLLSSRRCTPEGDPNVDGSLVDQRDTRPLRHLFPELDEAIATSLNEQLAEAQTERSNTVVHAVFPTAS